jgi:hypothetical protein
MRRLVVAAALLLLAPGCIWFSDDDDDGGGGTGAYPCDHPDEWPQHIDSGVHPFRVHFESTADLSTAVEVVALLESAWEVEFGLLGFAEPVSDGGTCGGDERFDVFLWHDQVECYVDVLAENPETSWDDIVPYMVVDAWGPYGGDILDSTLAHELNHAAQGAYDWNEPLSIFEMTSTFMEDVVFDADDEYLDLLPDFQDFPDWSIDSSDEPGDNWFLYAASLYLFYVRDRHFAGDPAFIEEVWALSKNPPGTNEPDFEDAFDTVLGNRSSMTYVESVADFAKWRWYTGSRDDGAHFEEGALYAMVPVVSATAGAVVAADPQPMLLGSSYLEISRGGGGTAPIDVSVAATPGVVWVVQAVPGIGGGDGEELDLSGAFASVVLTTAGTRTLVITALPAGPYDVDSRTDERFPLTVTLGP